MIEKILTEIYRLKKDLEGYSAVEALDYIESYINILQREQPEVDLEKIIGQTYHDGSVTDTSNMDHVGYENIARYFYELGLKARKEE